MYQDKKRKSMNFWITSDTHFGHDALMDYCDRPQGFDGKILRNFNQLESGDVLIHLGDICIGNDSMWHSEMFPHLYSVKRWLIKGNHDKKSDTWYLDKGWDFVGTSFLMNRFGLNILFSHKPVKNSDYFDINIHGHFHNTDPGRHKESFEKIKHNKHLCVILEHHYAPQNLKTIIKNKKEL